jgi:DHA1 family multidrug resistance protein-like MFS transporter
VTGPTARPSEPVALGIPSRKLTIGLYLASVFLFWMAQYIYLPTLPTYVQSKVDDLAVVGVVLSMFGLWQALIRLPIGIAADWLGWRKPFILIGLGLAGLGAWIMGTANTVNGLTIGRAVTGLSAGAWVPLVVGFSALFPPKEAVKASSLLTLFNSVGRVLATSVTGALNNLGGYSLAFYVATGIAALSIIIMAAIGEIGRPPTRPSVGGIGRLIVRRDVLVPSLLSAVGQYAHWAISLGFMLVLVKQLGGTSVTQSLFATISIALMAGGNLWASSLSSQNRGQWLVVASFVMMFGGIVIATLSSSLVVLAIAQAIMGLAQGIGYPVLMGMSIEHVSNAERSTAMGLHQSVYAIGMFAGPAFSGVIAAAIGIQPMFAVTAAGCLALGLVGAYWLDR